MPDRYQEIAPVGKYKNIWLVLDRDTEKIYVKKCLETFNQEVYRRIAGLYNVHIPGIAAWKLEDGRLWLIEEYINGETLEERLDRGYSFAREEAAGIVRQVCEALACLHSQEPPIIHRDVKLSNIMISHDGIVKLIDYNAARLYERGLSQDTRLIGTEAYAAPEQFGFAQTDARTDIYALGVVFNYLLTGEHIKDRMAEGACGAVIRKCTQMDPKQRYQSVWELDRALQTLQMNGSDRDGVTAEATVRAEATARAEMAESLCVRPAPALQAEKGMNGHSAGWSEANDRGTDRSGADGSETGLSEKGVPGSGIWPIPGFRSGVWWKKLLAAAGYLFIFYLSLTVEPELDVGRPLSLWTDRILVLVSMLFTVAVYADYRGAAAKMPLLHNEKRWIRWLGYCMVWPFTLGILIMLKEAAFSLVRAMLKI